MTQTQVRLSQIVAVEKTIKQKVNKEGGDLHKLNQKPDLFNGFVKSFEKKAEEAEDLPPEQKLVQQYADANLNAYVDLWKELLDVVATKDFGNASVRADLKIDDQVLIPQCPVPYLLWLEKQLDDLKTYLVNLPTLSPEADWKPDPSRGYRTEAVRTGRNQTVPQVIVKVAATEQHPAQTEIVQTPILTGYWSRTALSGAMPAEVRKLYLDRAEQLRKAAKFAREEANANKIDRQQVADTLVSWLLRTAS